MSQLSDSLLEPIRMPKSPVSPHSHSTHNSAIKRREKDWEACSRSGCLDHPPLHTFPTNCHSSIYVAPLPDQVHSNRAKDQPMGLVQQVLYRAGPYGKRVTRPCSSVPITVQMPAPPRASVTSRPHWARERRTALCQQDICDFGGPDPWVMRTDVLRCVRLH